MELKLSRAVSMSASCKLLIVPYGIETCSVRLIPLPSGLLIVPYGIETCHELGYLTDRCLLIVPYGIETVVLVIVPVVPGLLIVPYGIETLPA